MRDPSNIRTLFHDPTCTGGFNTFLLQQCSAEWRRRTSGSQEMKNCTRFTTSKRIDLYHSEKQSKECKNDLHSAWVKQKWTSLLKGKNTYTDMNNLSCIAAQSVKSFLGRIHAAMQCLHTWSRQSPPESNKSILGFHISSGAVKTPYGQKTNRTSWCLSMFWEVDVVFCFRYITRAEYGHTSSRPINLYFSLEGWGLQVHCHCASWFTGGLWLDQLPPQVSDSRTRALKTQCSRVQVSPFSDTGQCNRQTLWEKKLHLLVTVSRFASVFASSTAFFPNKGNNVRGTI